MSAPLQLVPQDEVFSTRLFGRVAIPVEVMVRFPDGLPGFAESREFALLPAATRPLTWLQSLENPALAFLLIDWSALVPASPDPMRDAYAIVTLSQGDEPATANLLAPVLVDPVTQRGEQIILSHPGLSTAVAFDLPALVQVP